jgi:hypothetical protein
MLNPLFKITQNTKNLFFVLFFWLNLYVLIGQTAFGVPTFHNISIYWSPNGGSIDKKVLIKYKNTNENTWHDALPMKYNPIQNAGNNPITGERYDRADYRGSIVNLTPNTIYDIQLVLEGTSITDNIQITTWSEDFPIGQTISPGDLTTRLTYSGLKGTPDAYILIDGTGSTINIQDNSLQCIRLIDCEYLIIRGYTLTNAMESAIRLFDSHHIIIENCDISQWGEEDIPGTGFGKNYQAGIYAGSNDAHHCIIQRNRIHHPKWDTNSWAELHDPAADPTINSNYHPAGPQAIALGECNIGNNVIRYNEIWSDSDHYFNDIMGMWSNASYAGFPGPDSDIYGNYLANCFDDGIEAEGGNMNVRIWNNYIENVFLGIGNAATSIGPLYIWRNVSGRADSMPNSVYGQYGGFIKMGYANSIDWMTGHMYVFNNTILQPSDHGTGGLGTSNNSNRYIFHCESRNNILHVRSDTENSISIRNDNGDNDFDYDLTNHSYPTGHEEHGLTGTPDYNYSAPLFDFNSKTGNFELSPTSLGYNDGVFIPNFTQIVVGSAPDMGAHEHGTGDITYGVHANFSPPVLSYEEKEQSQIKLFPVPTNKVLHIINNIENKELKIKIYDLLGKNIFTGQLLKSYEILNVEDFKRGIYFVKIYDDAGYIVKTSKIIID